MAATATDLIAVAGSVISVRVVIKVFCLSGDFVRGVMELALNRRVLCVHEAFGIMLDVNTVMVK